MATGPSGEMLGWDAYLDMYREAGYNAGYNDLTLLDSWEIDYKSAFAKKGTGKEDDLGPDFSSAHFYSLGKSEQAQIRLTHFNSLAPNNLQTLAKVKGIAPNLGKAAIIEKLGQMIDPTNGTLSAKPKVMMGMAKATGEGAVFF